MGDIADMMCDGTLDSSTGEYLGPGGGYPRSMDPDSPDYVGRRERDPNRKMNPTFGVENYLKGKGETEFGQITAEYFADKQQPMTYDHKKRCAEISNDFSAFVKWYNKRKSKKP